MIHSGNFPVTRGGYLLLIRKDSVTHMHGLAVHEKNELPFARDVSLENSADSFFIFATSFILFSVLLLFRLSSITLFVFMHSF